MNQKESVVAVVTQAETMDEEQLSQQVTDIEFQAESFVIQTEADYSAAGEFGKLLKQKAAEVTGFFKPMKDSAYQAHKAVCDREKAMLAPVRNAEKTIKKAMGDYLMEQERIRREAEETARRSAEKERERKLKEAIQLEAAGDKEGAEAAFEEGMVMDEAASYSIPVASKPKVSGISMSKDWEITGIDPKKVPVEFSGMELRPIDQAVVMRLIRASKGSIAIPGISYHEVAKMSFRR